MGSEGSKSIEGKQYGGLLYVGGPEKASLRGWHLDCAPKEDKVHRVTKAEECMERY